MEGPICDNVALRNCTTLQMRKPALTLSSTLPCLCKPGLPCTGVVRDVRRADHADGLGHVPAADQVYGRSGWDGVYEVMVQ
jgi:hypothetical protein